MGLQHMGQQRDVDGIVGHAETIRGCHEVDTVGRTVLRRCRAPGAGEVTERLPAPETDLQKLVTENTLQRPPDSLAFLAQQGTPAARLEPFRTCHQGLTATNFQAPRHCYHTEH